MALNERVPHSTTRRAALYPRGVKKAADGCGGSLKSVLALTKKELLTVPRLFLHLQHEANTTNLTEIRAPDTYSKYPAQGQAHIFI